MTHTRRGLHAAILLLAAGLTGLGCNCGDNQLPGDPDAGLDAGAEQRDASLDAGAQQGDAGVDAGTEQRDAGRDAGQSATGTVTRFRPSILGRQSHAMVELADGTVLVSGSIRTPSPISGRPEAELFDLNAETVTTVGPMQDGRHSHQLTLLADGRVLVTGGYGGSPPAPWRTAELYDPATRKFTRLASEMTTARLGHAAVRLTSGALAGKVLLIGGGALGGVVTVELFDPATSTFSAVTTTGAPPAREATAIVVLADQSVLLTAGRTTSGGAAVTQSYVYQPSTATFRQVGDAVEARLSPTATTLLDGRVLVVGGSTGVSSALATTELFDPATGTFSAGPSMAMPRRTHSAALLGSSRLVVAGGNTGTVTLGTTELFVPASGLFTAGADLVAPRSFLKCLSLSDGRVFVNGGQYMGGLLLGTAEVISD